MSPTERPAQPALRSGYPKPGSDAPHAEDSVLVRSDLALPDRREGKVRDVYALPPGSTRREAQPNRPAPGVLLVASDRLSAFDVVLPTPVPGKGVLLTQLSTFWLRFIEREGLSPTHLVSTDADDLDEQCFRPGSTARADLVGRVTLGRACRVIPVECVVRGYLEGSGWKDYQRSGSVCGLTLPSGLVQCARLDRPIFTPASKAERGEHDENIGIAAAARSVDALARTAGTTGTELMTALERTSLRIFESASEIAARAGLLLADTKFEFGLPVNESGELTGEGPILIDEALTPDSSRYWPLDQYEPGHAQPSYDKQFVREYLERLVARGAWNKAAPGPELPAEVIEKTLAKYREAVERLGAAL